MNERAYAYHYRSLDSTRVYAQRALVAAGRYDAGRAEALNNLAFVSLSKMDYRSAFRQLDSIAHITDNQVELLIADIQLMRLCQRESRNKEFYDYHEQALRRMRRIEEEQQMLNEHQRRRFVYALSEFNIVTSTYYYYVGLERQSIDALREIDPDGEIRTDTAQLLAYYYNVGAGGIITEGSQDDINQQEFDYLMRCYLLARQHGYPFWEANSLQAMSEHIQVKAYRDRLLQDNLPAMKFINVDQMPDSLLAGNLAQRSLDLFEAFGDVYQIAGAYRTLAQCYWQINDFSSAIICLENALNKNKAIEQAPDLVASIREQLSVVYSAIDDKQSSDYNRNIYLDLQEETRQDRYLESRADQLNRSSQQLNWMIVAVVTMIVAVVLLLLLFDWLRRRSNRKLSMKELLAPLSEWQRRHEQAVADLEEQYEDIQESYAMQTVQLAKSKRRNLEQRAKVSLVNTVTPFIDRMLNEIHRLKHDHEDGKLRQERYEYIAELTDQINDYNNVLTEWIQMRQGELRLHIESFPMQQLFDIVKRSRMSFKLKDVDLEVHDTAETVKADRVLTLFMINTMADNARKFTSAGGKVDISARAADDYVEVSIADTGKGMTANEQSHVFDYKPISNPTETVSERVSHGYGLMNCKGIIEKYKKVSQIFSVCAIGVESEEGRGSRFFFRLPKGVVKTACSLLLWLLSLGFPTMVRAAESETDWKQKAEAYADSVYDSNIHGEYQRALDFAADCLHAFNVYYATISDGTTPLLFEGKTSELIPEVQWLNDSIPVNYDVLLSVRNECAVAALALHRWSLYRYNNKVYTQLFKKLSADTTLEAYCRMMQRSESNKNVAVGILLLLLLSIFPAYYFIYYRQHLNRRFCFRQIEHINGILLGNMSDEEKLRNIRKVDTTRFPAELQEIVSKVTSALEASIRVNNASQTNIELAEDECRRIQMEDEKLHVANSVLDNCLSTLKHETMYYPSRIRYLIDGRDDNLNSIDELAAYYKELYSILSMQAMRQVETTKIQCGAVKLSDVLPIESDVVLIGDRDLLRELFSILRRDAKADTANAHIASADSQYVTLTIPVPALRLTHEQCLELFQPHVDHLPFLLCRQIMRDIGEATNKRGCGIRAENGDQGICIVITLAVAKGVRR